MAFDPRKLITCDGTLAVFLNRFDNILHLDFHTARESELANNWEWLRVRGTHTAAKAVRLAVASCVRVCIKLKENNNDVSILIISKICMTAFSIHTYTIMQLCT